MLKPLRLRARACAVILGVAITASLSWGAGVLAYSSNTAGTTSNGIIEALTDVVARLDTLIAGGSGAGTGDVNVKQVAGATVKTGAGTAAGALRVELPTDGTGLVSAAQSGSWTVTATSGGNVADAAADSGNPVKVAGIYESTQPNYTTGQRGQLHVGTRGALLVQVMGADGTSGANAATMNADALSANTTGLAVRAGSYAFNGSTWDRLFSCTSSAAVSVTAGATTELVALTSAQIIRVCSFTLTEAAAGTAKFVTGTGTNCGTGQADITAAMVLPTNGSLSLSSGNGSLFRGATANALCLTAVSGTVTGFISYAKF